jgi:ubiquinone/menaquinone biosynthesis C-methylase UbiE
MEEQFQTISAQQKVFWNKFSPGWKKWDADILAFMHPFADEIIQLLQPTGSQVILDIAAGTGEPGLSIAAMLTDGKVIMTDLAEDMLDIARENALKRDVKNVDFHVCDVSELPFADNTFDAVSCRMGFMFFPDMLLAAKEIHRVLKPGGRIATAVWGTAEKNFWVTATGNTINKNMQLPLPPPDAPGMFRCAKSGLLTSLFKDAGFKNTAKKEVTGKLNCGSAERYWTMMTEIAAPFVSALSKADNVVKEIIKKEVCYLVSEKYPGNNIVMEGTALIVYGEK